MPTEIHYIMAKTSNAKERPNKTSSGGGTSSTKKPSTGGGQKKSTPNISNKSRPAMKSNAAAAAGPSANKRNNNKNRKRGSGSAKPQYSHFEQQRLDRLREKDERRAIKEEKLIARKKERTKRIKILTKKNRKGQPLMNGRMELLLEKIQKSMWRRGLAQLFLELYTSLIIII